MSEQAIQQRIRLACGRGISRLWRNNVGTGWAGRANQVRHACTMELRPGDVVIQNARPLHAGLCPGSADLIGYRSITIGPEHVGQTLAVFAAVEVKSPTGRPTSEQTAFLEHVRAAGGLAGIARSVEDAERILQAAAEPPQRFQDRNRAGTVGG